MPKAEIDNFEDISGGYKLFKRGDTWHVRFSLKGQGQQRLALGTSDESVAELLAEQKWREKCVLVRHGLAVKGKTFRSVAEEFIDKIEREVEHGHRAEYQARQYPNIIRTYFIEHFGSRVFGSITSPDIERYWDWRRVFWTTGPGANRPYIVYERTFKGRTARIRRPVKEGAPSDSTLAKEAMLFKQLFDYGARRGYTARTPVVALEKSKRRIVRSRPDFTLDEFNRLLAVSAERAMDESVNEHVRNDRSKLHAFCHIAGYTGLRVTELCRLLWKDITPRKIDMGGGIEIDALIINARGKGKVREVATMPEIDTALNVLRNIFILEVGREVEGDDPVFANADGTPIRTFRKGMTTLLEAAGLLYASDGRKRDSFSFRHFYITQQVRSNVNHHVLARNAGTSTAMIDQYYSKVRPTEEISKLTPDWHGRRKFIEKLRTADIK